MALEKNVASQKLAVYAYDTAADGPKTGDAANITAQISKDFGAAAATDDVNPTELDATDHPGIYVFDLTQAETNADNVLLSAVSGTSDIVIDPIQVFTVPPNFRALGIESDGSVTSLAASAVDAILDEAVGDGTITMREALRILIAGMAGKLSGAATTSITIRNLADSANVVVATVDADGNRSAVTVTP